MLIVIEGPDRVGKSTMVAELAKQIGERDKRKVLSLHRGAPKDGDHPLHDYALPVSTYSPTMDGDQNTATMVCDRWHVGDLVYGPIYRGEMRQTAEMFQWTEALITARGGVRVHMTANPALIIKRIQAEGEDNSYLKTEHVLDVVRAYRQMCQTPWTTIETTGWNGPAVTEAAATTIVNTARHSERTALPIFMSDSDYVGPHKPAILLVGEDTGISTKTAGRVMTARERVQPQSYAAFTPWPGSAGEYLIGCLIDANWDLTMNVGLTSTDSYDLGGLVGRLGNPKIVAMGDLAEAKLHAMGLPIYTTVPHPAYERHYNSKKRGLYVKRFRAIIDAAMPLTARRSTTSLNP